MYYLVASASFIPINAFELKCSAYSYAPESPICVLLSTSLVLDSTIFAIL